MAPPPGLPPGSHLRQLESDALTRSYLVHVPRTVPKGKAVAVVLALHGAAMNARLMESFCGLSATAERGGFVVVYPNGTGTGPFLAWNAGGFMEAAGDSRRRVDDVGFIRRLLDDLATVLPLDSNRVYACGMSNGGMMSYRLAAELSDRIAAIAPVAGTIARRAGDGPPQPTRPVPVLHIHGTADRFVPYEARGWAAGLRLQGVEDSVRTWVQVNGCRPQAVSETLTQPDDPMPVTRRTHGHGRYGAEVVLVTIQGGGHTWPGVTPMVEFIGPSTTNIAANDLIWDFFRRHPRRSTHSQTSAPRQ
ncbi:MAG: hypothetical protein RJA22_233 [Verrucomicrobiota bacterium]